MSGGPTRPPPRTQALSRTDRAPLRALPAREIQELWFATLRRRWRTLALVPAHEGGSALELARALADFGSFHQRRPLRVISAEGMGLQEIAELTMEMEFSSGPAAFPGDEQLTVIALEPIMVNPLGTAVALAADAVILCVDYGMSNLDMARKTIEQIGHERFIGCVALKPRR